MTRKKPMGIMIQPPCRKNAFQFVYTARGVEIFSNMIIQFPAKLAKKLRTYRPVKRVGWEGGLSIIVLNLSIDESGRKLHNDHSRHELKDQEKTNHS
jgi:hypothetical protein